jgi:hypothetical protein
MDYQGLINMTRDFQCADISSNDKALIYRIINSEASTYRIASSKFRFRQQNFQETSDYTALKRLIELRYVEENQEQRRMFGGTTVYRFTTYGLLCVFANKLIYPPQLLLNYSASNVLRTLVFSYFETKTVSQGTARFFEAITEYLNECAGLLTNQNFPLASVKLALMYRESNLLIISSTLMQNDSARVSLYELESSMKGLIAADRKFMHLLEETKREFDEIK